MKSNCTHSRLPFVSLIPLAKLGKGMHSEAVSFMKKRESFCGLLVGNYTKYGPSRLQDQLFSGDFMAFIKHDHEEDVKHFVGDEAYGHIFGAKTIGMYCLTVSGTLLFEIETVEELKGLLDLDENTAQVVFDGMIERMYKQISDETISKYGGSIKGVIGEYKVGSTIVDKLFRLGVWKQDEMALQEKENLYSFTLDKFIPKTHSTLCDSSSNITSRKLMDSDFSQYVELKGMFEKEMGLTASSLESLSYTFKTTITYGTFYGEKLCSTASLNSWSDSHATIGFVYTIPDMRRKGLARCTFDLLFQDCKDELRLKCLDLFTNTADHFYIELGFELVGETCMCMSK
ncbi:hypothetical protein C9374_003689 [Naegleria lovaniensis]|uniref:N-acetyltransferase domain-containing protein n=1 Tax=Naegleria lovaniensis TaxID=51637 RepID=A0AA88KYD5_NAELO|nr:uncharacterized protein C9374_003689 [Naegleria lovaniensis]KAG2393925.1 hypothetical protein C9374_003689 [Naegleria lovaniensis]